MCDVGARHASPSSPPIDDARGKKDGAMCIDRKNLGVLCVLSGGATDILRPHLPANQNLLRAFAVSFLSTAGPPGDLSGPLWDPLWTRFCINLLLAPHRNRSDVNRFRNSTSATTFFPFSASNGIPLIARPHPNASACNILESHIPPNPSPHHDLPPSHPPDCCRGRAVTKRTHRALRPLHATPAPRAEGSACRIAG